MDQLLRTLPRWMFVGIALLAGLVVIVILNPPHTRCDSQYELFQKSQENFLFVDPKLKFQKRTGYDKAVETCKQGNSPGSCLDLFQGMKAVARNIEVSEFECHAHIANESIVSKAFTETLDLMVRLAWGEKPPENVYIRQNWLDTSHMALFCELKRLYIEAKGEDTWASFREDIMNALPQAQTLPRNELWVRSILSYSCSTIGD